MASHDCEAAAGGPISHLVASLISVMVLLLQEASFTIQGKCEQGPIYTYMQKRS